MYYWSTQQFLTHLYCLLQQHSWIRWTRYQNPCWHRKGRIPWSRKLVKRKTGHYGAGWVVVGGATNQTSRKASKAPFLKITSKIYAWPFPYFRNKSGLARKRYVVDSVVFLIEASWIGPERQSSVGPCWDTMTSSLVVSEKMILGSSWYYYRVVLQASTWFSQAADTISEVTGCVVLFSRFPFPRYNGENSSWFSKT